jgi:hypothetical protein
MSSPSAIHWSCRRSRSWGEKFVCLVSFQWVASVTGLFSMPKNASAVAKRDIRRPKVVRRFRNGRFDGQKLSGGCHAAFLAAEKSRPITWFVR